MKTMINIAKEFALNGNITNIAPYGSGHINSTYLINTDSGNEYILQKINTSVFKIPYEFMENIVGVTNYLQEIIKNEGGDPQREVLNVILT